MSACAHDDSIAAGSEFGSCCRVTEEQLDLAIALTGGTHPVHVSAQAAHEAGFRGRIFHGAVTAAIMAAAIGKHFRYGRVALLEQKNRFVAPVYPGDTLVTTWTVLEKRDDKRTGETILVLDGRMINQDGAPVLQSQATVLIRN